MTALSRTEQCWNMTARESERRTRSRPGRSSACQRRIAPLLAPLEDRTLLTPTLTTLAVSAPSLVYGQKEVLTADVTTNPPGGATPSGGTVSFYDGSTSIGTMALSAGTAALATTGLGAGTQVMVAVYSGSGAFAASSSGWCPRRSSTTWPEAANGGPATCAGLNMPYGVAVDSHGDVFISDSGNNLIREVMAGSGAIVTVAGNGMPGYTGDGGQATNAELHNPVGIAVDSAGDIFFVQYDDNVVREVHAATGVITTVAGNGTSGYSGDGGQATAAQLDEPSGVAVDSSGNLFIADTGNYRIREVKAATGVITTVAGNGTSGGAGDGSLAIHAELEGPEDLALDSSGDIYIADGFLVREVSAANGIITTIAGGGSNDAYDYSGSPTGAGFEPFSIALDSAGNIFIADSYTSVIREINAAGTYMETIAGGEYRGFNGDGLPAHYSELDLPFGVAVDASGDVFIADTYNDRIREVNGSTDVISTFAGTGATNGGGDGGPANEAQLDGPTDVAFTPSGDMLIADSHDNVIREVNTATGVITTVAGNATSGDTGDGGPATAAELNDPMGVAVDSAGDIFIADSGNNVIREVGAATGTITKIAGTGGFPVSDYGNGGPALEASLEDPQGLLLSSGSLFIADTGDSQIRNVDLADGIITDVAGFGHSEYSGDGGPALFGHAQ